MEGVGIIGFGRFGRAFGMVLEEAGMPFLALDPKVEVSADHRSESLQDLASRASRIALAVPVPAMESVLGSLLPFLTHDHTVFDVGSVKAGPCHLLDALLGDAIPHVGTHPLFGPVSLARAERPFRTVICPSPRHPAAAREIRDFFLSLGFEVVEETPEDHDRVMAQTHALTFFLAKGLLDVGCGGDLPFTPPSFHAIARTLESVRGDAGHLFAAIQNENPFASQAREHLLEALQSIHQELLEAAKAGTPQPEALAIPDLGSRSPELQQTRIVIDELDRMLVSLLGRRMELARKAGQVKAELGAPVLDPSREEALLVSRKTWAKELGLDAGGVEEVFRSILRASRRAQGA